MRGWRRFPFCSCVGCKFFLSPPSLLYLLRVIYTQCKGLERDILIVDVHHCGNIRNNRRLLSLCRRPVSGSILRLVTLAHEVDCIYDDGKARTLLAVLRLPLVKAKLAVNRIQKEKYRAGIC